MNRRLWLLAMLGVLGLAGAGVAEEPILLNADQISFQLSRTRSLSAPKLVELPAVTFKGATDRLTAKAERQLEQLAGALNRESQRSRTFAILASPGSGGPDGIGTRRAAAVRDYLIERLEIDPARFLAPDPRAAPPRAGISVILGR
jgi:outer membrane protein OmpA-like peptidoglycan-associated protein